MSVTLYEPQHGPRSLAVVRFSGDKEIIPCLPGAYFDKIFSNLRADPVAASDLLHRATAVFADFEHAIEEDGWAYGDVMVGVGDRSPPIPGKDGAPVAAAYVVDDADGRPMAQVVTRVKATDSRLGATTDFEPPLLGENPTVAELGFWALWDWTVAVCVIKQAEDMVIVALERMTMQLGLHEVQGVPGITEIGLTPAIVWRGYDYE